MSGKSEPVESTLYNILGMNCIYLDESMSRLGDRLRDYDDTPEVRYHLRMAMEQARTVSKSLRRLIASIEKLNDEKQLVEQVKQAKTGEEL
jgi:signal transduction histidine kinase